MALEEELPEKPEDKTIPKYRQIDKVPDDFALDSQNHQEDPYVDCFDAQRVGEYLMEFKDAFYKEYTAQRNDRSASPLPIIKKRAASPVGASANSSKKRIKSEPVSQKDGGGGGLTDKEMAAFNDRGTIGKVSISVFLRKYGDGCFLRVTDFLDSKLWLC